eukprot:7342681-Lingulodinium_polyedra.AAC.1
MDGRRVLRRRPVAGRWRPRSIAVRPRGPAGVFRARLRRAPVSRSSAVLRAVPVCCSSVACARGPPPPA